MKDINKITENLRKSFVHIGVTGQQARKRFIEANILLNKDIGVKGMDILAKIEKDFKHCFGDKQ